MTGDKDELQGLSIRMGTAEKRDNTINNLS